MRFRTLAVLALLGGAAAVGGGNNTTPVEKVVALLQDLQERIEGDGKEDQQIYDKFACWCEKTTKRKAAEILEGQALLRQLGQQILKLKAVIAQRAQEIEDLVAEIKGQQEAIKELTAARENENAEYAAKTTELMQALNALERAIIVLHKATSEASFIQGRQGSQAAAQAAAQDVRAAIAALPATAGLAPEHLADITAFLEEASRSGAAYAPQSATVQGILKDMYDTMASDLEDATKDEAKQNTDFEGVLAVKLEILHEHKAAVEKKYKEKAEAETELAEAQQSYDDTQKELNADIAFFDQAKAACEAKHAEWTVRKGEREAELQGIKEALAILTSDDARELFGKAIKPGLEPTFLQLGGANSAAAASELKAYHALKASARKAQSLRLAALAATVRTAAIGHFDEVIKAIDEMIDVLKQENSDDIKKRDECKDEYQKINVTVADLSWKIEKNVAQIDKLENLIKEREDEKEQTILEIAETKATIVAMEQQRISENQAFLQAKSDDQGAIGLLEKAKAALSKYYQEHKIDMGPIQGSVKGVFLIQQEPAFEVSADQAPDATFKHKGARKGESKGIISILTMVIEDLHGEIKTGMEAEAAAQLEFEKSLAAAKKLQTELEETVSNLMEMIAQRKAELNDEQGLMKSNRADLDEELAYKKEIAPDCDWILNAFEERAEKRKAEMEGLVTAKEYLAGAAPPAMLQTGNKAAAAAADRPPALKLSFRSLAFLQRRPQ